MFRYCRLSKMEKENKLIKIKEQKYNFQAFPHSPDWKTVTPQSRCSENDCVLCCSNGDMTAETNLNGLETMCGLILKLSHLNIIHPEFLALIAVPVCLRAKYNFWTNQQLGLSLAHKGDDIRSLTHWFHWLPLVFCWCNRSYTLGIWASAQTTTVITSNSPPRNWTNFHT